MTTLTAALLAALLTATPGVPAGDTDAAPSCSGVYVVGDSITSWDPPYARDPGQTWVTTALTDGLELAGGWATPGAPLAMMRDNVTAAPTACYLLVMGGTNDLAASVPTSDSVAALTSIIDTVDADHVILSAVAPLGLNPSGAVAWNATLHDLAAAEGYRFIDPWEDFRTVDGLWEPGGSLADNVHPTPATAAWVGARITAQVDRFAVVDTSRPGSYPTVS